MKVILTIAKKITEQGKITRINTEEIVVENVAKFEVDEGIQKITLLHNSEELDLIQLLEGDVNHLEQWFLLDIKVFQIPLKVQ